jgi:hypothetical protein
MVNNGQAMDGVNGAVNGQQQEQQRPLSDGKEFDTNLYSRQL